MRETRVVYESTRNVADATQTDVGHRTTRIANLDWAHFASDVSACTACGLARTRNMAVPGVGDMRADWLFVGEAPGAEEDAKGEPFVIAKSGKPLVKVVALEAPSPSETRRLGFMAGQIAVPDDFDSMGGAEIERLFGDGA